MRLTDGPDSLKAIVDIMPVIKMNYISRVEDLARFGAELPIHQTYRRCRWSVNTHILRGQIGVGGAHECTEIDLISDLSRKLKERKCWLVDLVAQKLKLKLKMLYSTLQTRHLLLELQHLGWNIHVVMTLFEDGRFFSINYNLGLLSFLGHNGLSAYNSPRPPPFHLNRNLIYPLLHRH